MKKSYSPYQRRLTICIMSRASRFIASTSVVPSPVTVTTHSASVSRSASIARWFPPESGETFCHASSKAFCMACAVVLGTRAAFRSSSICACIGVPADQRRSKGSITFSPEIRCVNSLPEDCDSLRVGMPWRRVNHPILPGGIFRTRESAKWTFAGSACGPKAFRFCSSRKVAVSALAASVLTPLARTLTAKL